MKNSPDHLPKYKQNELARVVQVIRAASEDVEMVVLYGSYARGKWKEPRDLKPDRKSGHVSDYDILVVTGEQTTAYDTVLWEDVAFECRRLGLSAYPRIITHDVEFVNNRLSEGQFFFKDIEREGCLLYDSGCVTLAKQRRFTPEERRRIAQAHFDTWFHNAQEFFETFRFELGRKVYNLAAFQLHQSAESAYKAILLVFTNYCPHEHFLGVLGLMAEAQDASLQGIFPRDTQAQRDRFKLFDYAYIGGRYDANYKISEQQLSDLSAHVRRLLKLTEQICRAKLDQIYSPNGSAE